MDSIRPGAKHSTYSSDKYRAIWGARYFDKNSNISLGEQLSNYLKYELKAMNPKDASNYSSLPQTDERKIHSGVINKTTNPVFIQRGKDD